VSNLDLPYLILYFDHFSSNHFSDTFVKLREKCKDVLKGTWVTLVHHP
jgi:hypothetical protein